MGNAAPLHTAFDRRYGDRNRRPVKEQGSEYENVAQGHGDAVNPASHQRQANGQLASQDRQQSQQKPIPSLKE